MLREGRVEKVQMKQRASITSLEDVARLQRQSDELEKVRRRKGEEGTGSGGGRQIWVFYTCSLARSLAPLPLRPSLELERRARALSPPNSSIPHSPAKTFILRNHELAGLGISGSRAPSAKFLVKSSRGRMEGRPPAFQALPTAFSIGRRS